MNINKNIINIIKRNDVKFKNIKFMQDENYLNKSLNQCIIKCKNQKINNNNLIFTYNKYRNIKSIFIF